MTLQTTRTVSLNRETYEEAVKAREEMRAKGDPVSSAISASDTSFLSYLVKTALIYLKEHGTEVKAYK